MTEQATQDYLKTIYEIEDRGEKVSTNELAAHLGITAASVSGMLKKLAQRKLVAHVPYQGVKLTSQGKKIALGVLRQHRLLELFLSKTLGIPWDRVHQEAEQLEHVISKELENRIDAFLGYPKFDPHGSPIPSKSGKIPNINTVSLDRLSKGDCAVIAQVMDHDAKLLQYLDQKGLHPGIEIKVMDIDPFEGPFLLQIGTTKQSVALNAAKNIYVVFTKSKGKK
jgi:DtxR family Mn-dependent transcriptional regulator